MKLYLKLPIQGLTEALVEATGEHVRRTWDHMNTPEEWEDEFDHLHDRFTDLVPDGHVEVEFDLAAGTARVLLDPVADIEFESCEIDASDFAEVC